MAAVSLAVTLVLLLSQSMPTGTPVAAIGSQNAIEEELIALDKRIEQAHRNGDTAFLREMLTDDLLRVTQSGELEGKAQIVKAAEGRAANPAAPAMPGVDARPQYTIRLHRDTAIVVHSEKATDTRPSSAVLHVFVRPQGRWKMAAWTNASGEL